MLIRLCYSSKYAPNDFTLVEDIRDILVIARKFNQKHNIYGVLYYADGSFFQCLEGENDTVKNLYNNIIKDTRHHNVKLLKIEPIKNIKFKSWTMKYVEASSSIKALFKELNFDQFIPENLNQQQLDQTLNLLYKENDSFFPPNSAEKNQIFAHYF